MKRYRRFLLAIAFAAVASRPINGAGCPAVVHRLTYNDVGTAAVGTLPVGVTVVASQAGVKELALAYQTSLQHGQTPSSNAKRSLVAIGPELEGPDQVQVASCKIENGRIELHLIHTSQELSGGGLRRNVPYRPMVELRLRNEAGPFQVEVDWQAVDSLSSAKPLAPAVKVGPITLTL